MPGVAINSIPINFFKKVELQCRNFQSVKWKDIEVPEIPVRKLLTELTFLASLLHFVLLSFPGQLSPPAIMDDMASNVPSHLSYKFILASTIC